MQFPPVLTAGQLGVECLGCGVQEISAHLGCSRRDFFGETLR